MGRKPDAQTAVSGAFGGHFGISEAHWNEVPERDGVRVVNVTPHAGQGPGQAGWWLRGAAVALGVLAAAAAVVSWDAQYRMVRAVKPVTVVAALEAGIPDVGAVIFAALGVALALHGKRAMRPRALNAACVGISLAMNALAAGHGWRDMAIWVMPAAVYAVASDTLIGVVRAWVLARARNQGETLAEDGPTPLAMVASLGLWLLRLSLAPRSTLRGFRNWVVQDCPVAPGVRPGHMAELLAVQQDAEQRIALTTEQCDQAIERAAAEVQQVREEAARTVGAMTAIRADADQVRADAKQLVAGTLADAAKERAELRTSSQAQVEQLREALAQGRADIAGLVKHVRDAADARVAALEEVGAQLRAERDRLAADLRLAVRQPPRRTRRPQAGRTQGPREGSPTKRDRMIELAGQRRDLATVPLGEVAKLASSVAREIGYNPGTARRELARHVRELQITQTQNMPESEGGEA
jgi:hypothetical protein